jgi:L-iditol 2-dehydrogenase
MKAAVLEDVAKMNVRDVPDPQVGPREVLLKVQAVGVCGTDLHIYRGHGNYNLDSHGRAVPLTEHPQILGHEFSGEVLEAGSEVKDLKVGDRVLCDQGRNCISQGRQPLCPYCATGDTHQCAFYQEHGITGLPGALAEYISVPAVNCLPIPSDMPAEQAALVEPLGCILHSSDRVERSSSRYTLSGDERIHNILITGAGPAGLLFLQYLRNVKHFEGLVMVSDVREKNLGLVREFSGTPINVAQTDLTEAVEHLTKGERVHYLIEACGNSIIIEQMPTLIRKQATVLFYGHGHQGRDIGLICTIWFLEPTMIASVGASGGFDPDGRPATYRRARELVHSNAVQVMPFVTHRYRSLDEIRHAFAEDFLKPEYIKGVLTVA